MSEVAAAFRVKQVGFLPGHLGLDWIDLRRGFAHGRFEIGKVHLAPNGYLHAAAVIGGHRLWLRMCRVATGRRREFHDGGA
jgi:hypothetical protein